MRAEHVEEEGTRPHPSRELRVSGAAAERKRPQGRCCAGHRAAVPENGRAARNVDPPFARERTRARALAGRAAAFTKSTATKSATCERAEQGRIAASPWPRAAYVRIALMTKRSSTKSTRAMYMDSRGCVRLGQP